MVVTGNFTLLLLPYLRKIFGDSYMEYPEEYSMVFDKDTSGRNYEQDHSITTFGLAQQKAQGKSIYYDTIYDGFTKTYTFVVWALGFQISREMLEDDQYRKMSQMPRALGQSMRETKEINCANVLNRATTAGYTGADGQTLLSASHPLVGGGTFSNMPTVAADLDVVSYEQALIDIQTNWVDDRGKKVHARPMKLIVAPANEFQAEMILKSAQLPDTPNNNINPLRGSMPGGIAKMHWLTDPDAWFIKTTVKNGLTFIQRRAIEFSNDNDFDSENAKYKSTERYDAGWTDPRCLYGTMGA